MLKKRIVYFFTAVFLICGSGQLSVPASSQPETEEARTGWQEIDGSLYYFSPETGEMQTGWQKIENETYYFSMETGKILTGWQEIGNKTYYFLPRYGEMQTGRQKIGSKTYLFGQNGAMQTSGLVKYGTDTYYCGPDGVLRKGWQTINGKKYYFSKKNYKMLTGRHKIKDSYYIFYQNGQLAQSESVSLVTVGNNIYCAGKNGKPACGWQIIHNKLYFASKYGRVKRNKTYQGIELTSTGAAKNSDYTKYKIKAMQVFRSITNDSMSKGQKLSASWKYIVGHSFRYAAKYPNLRKFGWQRQTAYDMLTTRSGNCYSFACAFAALAAEAGYSPDVICGRVRGSRDRAGDGFTRHAWVRINGRFYDPEAQYAGWMRGVYGAAGYPTAHIVQSVTAY